MKRIYYHGTSADNLESILKNGLSINEDKLWTCSEDAVYLWDTLALAEANGRDLEDDADYIEDETFRAARESGEIACAIAKDCRVVVVKVEIDETELSEDNSCENMAGSGAVVLYRNIPLSEIIEIHVSNDLSLIKGYFINLLIGRDYCNVDFNKMEIRVAECFKKAEIYPEDIDDLIEFEKIQTPSLIN